MTTCSSCALAIFLMRAFDLQVSFTRALPDKAARRHWLPEAKKKKEEQASTVEEESEDTEELGQHLHHAPGFQTEPDM